MKELKLLLKDVERELLANLLIGLKTGRVTKAEAKKASGEFVKDSYLTYEDLFEKLYLMSKSYKDARRVFVKYSPAYFGEKDQIALNTVREHFKNMSDGGDNNGR